MRRREQIGSGLASADRRTVSGTMHARDAVFAAHFLPCDTPRGAASDCRRARGRDARSQGLPEERATHASQPRKEIATPSSAMIISSAETAAKKVAPARSQAKRSASTVQTVSAMPATQQQRPFPALTGGGSPSAHVADELAVQAGICSANA